METGTTSERTGLWSELLILAMVVLAAAIASGVVGVLLFSTRMGTLLLAFAVCLVSSLVAHVAGVYPAGDANYAARMALQMVARTLPPLVVAVWAIKFAVPSFETSLVLYMILFYLVGLAADVLLTLGRLKRKSVNCGDCGSPPKTTQDVEASSI